MEQEERENSGPVGGVVKEDGAPKLETVPMSDSDPVAPPAALVAAAAASTESMQDTAANVDTTTSTSASTNATMTTTTITSTTDTSASALKVEACDDALPSDPDGSAATSSSSSSSSSSPPPTLSSMAVVPRPNTPPPMPPVDPASGRVLTSIVKPFIYGSLAFWRGKPTTELEHTHQWTVYLRGLESESLSYFIESVAFHLHASFAQPIRILTSPPFQVTETGWGEFSIIIVVNFIASARLAPVTLTHPLKLFPAPNVTPSTTKPVVAEAYDEFVFHRPTVELYHVLTRSVVPKLPPAEFDAFWNLNELAREEHQQIVSLAATAATIKRRIERERQRLHQIDQDIIYFSELLQSS